MIWRENHRGVQVPFWTGIEFDEATWDGSDIFRGADESSDFILTTLKAYKALIDAKIRNVELSPISETLIRAEGLGVRPQADD